MEFLSKFRKNIGKTLWPQVKFYTYHLCVYGISRDCRVNSGIDPTLPRANRKSQMKNLNYSKALSPCLGGLFRVLDRENLSPNIKICKKCGFVSCTTEIFCYSYQ
jgi:hypothetical protein